MPFAVNCTPIVKPGRIKDAGAARAGAGLRTGSGAPEARLLAPIGQH